jgi:hypothetical protein
MKGHGLVTKFVVYVDDNIVAYIADYSWSGPFAIDGNNWPSFGVRIGRLFMVDKSYLTALPSGLALIQLTSQL